jgi:hypothetical protein
MSAAGSIVDPESVLKGFIIYGKHGQITKTNLPEK